MATKDRIGLLSYLLLALIFRFWTFFPSVIDHDESTYILIANQLLDGVWPYVGNLDVKPIGIYLVFAPILYIFHDIHAIRIFASLCVGCTAYFIHKAHKNLIGHSISASITGVLFVFCASLHKWGWSANTEIFFVLCSAIALYTISSGCSLRKSAGIGIVLGIGFIIKYHILFDIIPYIVLFVSLYGHSFKTAAKHLAVAAVFFAIPISLVMFSYFIGGHLDSFLFATIIIPSRYSSALSLTKMFAFVGEFYLSFLPLSLLCIYGFFKIWKQKIHGSSWKLIWLTWVISTWLGVVITGKFHFHYLYQVLIPFVFIIASYVSTKKVYRNRFQSWIVQQRIVLIIVATLMIWGNQYIQLYADKPDYTRIISQEIKLDLDHKDVIYTNDKNILYYLCDTDPPTKYIHTSLLFKPDLIKAYAIDTAEVFDQIKAHQPKYYIIHDQAPRSLVEEIKKNYQHIKSYGKTIKLFRYKNGD